MLTDTQVELAIVNKTITAFDIVNSVTPPLLTILGVTSPVIASLPFWLYFIVDSIYRTYRHSQNDPIQINPADINLMIQILLTATAGVMSAATNIILLSRLLHPALAFQSSLAAAALVRTMGNMCCSNFFYAGNNPVNRFIDLEGGRVPLLNPARPSIQ